MASFTDIIKNNKLINEYSVILFKDFHIIKDDDNYNFNEIENKIDVGIEITYIDPKLKFTTDREGYFKYPSYDYNYEQYEITKDRIQELLDKKKVKLFKPVSQDCGSFEITSPPFTKLIDLFLWFLKIDTIMKDNGYVTHSKETDNGGLHFHIRLPNSELPIHAISNLTKLPYINWLFNNPIDNINANNPIYEFKQDFKLKKSNTSKLTEDQIHSIIMSQILTNNKSIMITQQVDPARLEFRYFDMPMNFNEFVLQSLFILELYSHYICTLKIRDIDYYHNYFTRIAKFPIDIMYKFNDVDLPYVKDKLVNLMAGLSLNINDYKPFIKRNLETRFSYGKEYLT